QGEVDEQVLGGAAADAVPLVGAGDAADQGEGPLEGAEAGGHLGGLRELVGLRQPAEAGGGGPGRPRAAPGAPPAGRGQARARGGGPAAVTAGEELLAGGLVLEDVEDAEGGGDGVGAELLLEVGLQLALLVELLEGAPPRQHAVAELDLRLAPPRHL